LTALKRKAAKKNRKPRIPNDVEPFNQLGERVTFFWDSVADIVKCHPLAAAAPLSIETR
jgi:hypothetical protein